MPNKKTVTTHYHRAKQLAQSKLKTLRAQEPPLTDQAVSHRAQFERLIEAGTSPEDVQKAWHEYYAHLTDDQKRKVWDEYNSELGQVDPSSQSEMKIDPGIVSGVIHHQTSPNKPRRRRMSQIAKENKVYDQLNTRLEEIRANKHFRAITFAATIGLIVLVLNFNELAIAKFKAFVTPGNVVATPVIIGDGSNQAVGPEARIIIPKINVDVPVVYDQPSVAEKDVQASLENGVVHYADTPKPGEPGNNVIVGHSSNNLFNGGKYKFAFVLLSKLAVDDTFVINYQSKRYIYRVYDKRIVKPNDVGVLGAAAKTYTVTLITCDPPGTAVNRLIIQAEQISPEPNQNLTPATSTASLPTQVPGNSPSLFHRLSDWLFH